MGVANFLLSFSGIMGSFLLWTGIAGRQSWLALGASSEGHSVIPLIRNANMADREGCCDLRLYIVWVGAMSGMRLRDEYKALKGS